MNMKYKIGFIGCGNMGGALAMAAAKSEAVEEVFLSDLNRDLLRARCKQVGGKESDNLEIASLCDIIVLAVKPQVYKQAIASIKETLAAREDKPLVISIAAGITIAAVRDMGIPDMCEIIRIMPNLPVSVGEGMILYACDRDPDPLLSVFAHAGKFVRLSEDKIDAGSAVSGCGPAFVCLFVEALADGAVSCGLSRSDALLLAEQTLIGTAKHLCETGIHPGALKDAVCSPGGTTIAGVCALEKGGFRAASTDAVIAAYEKTLMLKK